jgi:transposase
LHAGAGQHGEQLAQSGGVVLDSASHDFVAVGVDDRYRVIITGPVDSAGDAVGGFRRQGISGRLQDSLLAARACLTKISGVVVDAGEMSRFQLLSDAQWLLIADLLPARTGKQGRPFRDARQVVEGIIYRYRCGIAWRDVPAVFGPWQTIWTWHRRMSADGTWDVVLARLLSAAEAAGVIDWAVAVDSTIARAHQHATNITRHTGGWVELHKSAHRAA